jgi:hypothetical protein
MISEYEVKCKCGFSTKVKYGREGKSDLYEVFTCEKCKNLFSLHLNDEKRCSCGNEKLIQYNPNKDHNIKFFEENKDAMDKDKVKQIINFWSNTRSDECPRCNEKTLVWKRI